jgi:hypothetical protein
MGALEATCWHLGSLLPSNRGIEEESTMSIPEIACSLSIIFLSAFVLLV